MSSHGYHSSLGSGSDHSSSSRSNAIHESYRTPKAGGYKVDVSHRTGGVKDVSVYNLKAPGYEKSAPHPPYGQRGDSKKSSSRS